MSELLKEKVIAVHHWTKDLFTFRTTRRANFRFKNGHYTMIGLARDDGRPLLRAYSFTSANYDDYLEFFSIKVANGPLTSRLQHIKVGDEILVHSKSTGTLLVDNLSPAKHLYLLSTGTGLAPFMSIIKDPDVYEKFDKVILTHGVRYINELAYQQYITQELPQNEHIGDLVKNKLIYYPTVTREKYKTNGRITDLLKIGRLASDVGLPLMNIRDDRFMICGSPSMLKDTCDILESAGFQAGSANNPKEYVIEKAFVEKT